MLDKPVVLNKNAKAAKLETVKAEEIDDSIEADVRSIKAVLYGVSGTGKTVAAATLGKVKGIKRVMFIAVESNALAGLEAGMEIHKLTTEERKKFKVLRIGTGRRTVSTLLASVQTVLTNTTEGIAGKEDLQKGKYTRFTEVIRGMQSFTDIHGVDHGNITDWGEDTVVYIDGLTVILETIQQTIIGGKTLLSLPARGILQNMLMQYIRFLTEEVRCHVVLLAHPVRQKSTITGVESIFIETGGQALKDKVPSAFTDVIYTASNNGKYTWSTQALGVLTSARNLPDERVLQPTFENFKWERKDSTL